MGKRAENKCSNPNCFVDEGESCAIGEMNHLECEHFPADGKCIYEHRPCTYQDLFNHLAQEHGITATQGEMQDIVNIVNELNSAKQLHPEEPRIPAESLVDIIKPKTAA